MVRTKLEICVKAHKTGHLKKVNFTVYKSSLSSHNFLTGSSSVRTWESWSLFAT